MVSSVLASVTLIVWAAADSGVLCIGVCNTYPVGGCRQWRPLLAYVTLTVWAAADSGVLCIGVCYTYPVGGGRQWRPLYWRL